MKVELKTGTILPDITRYFIQNSIHMLTPWTHLTFDSSEVKIYCLRSKFTSISLHGKNIIDVLAVLAFSIQNGVLAILSNSEMFMIHTYYY